MKYAYLIFSLFFYSFLHSQEKKKQVLIDFDAKMDSVVTENGLPKYIWIRNPTYEEEMRNYTNSNEPKEKYTVKKQNKPHMPSEFYKYYILAEKTDTDTCKKYMHGKVFDKSKLGTITSRKSNVIVLNIPNNCSICSCYKVSFYDVIIE